MTAPTPAEVDAAVDVLRRAGWSVTTMQASGFLTANGRFVRTHPDSIPDTHQPHSARRAVEPYRRSS